MAIQKKGGGFADWSTPKHVGKSYSASKGTRPEKQDLAKREGGNCPKGGARGETELSQKTWETKDSNFSLQRVSTRQ